MEDEGGLMEPLGLTPPFWFVAPAAVCGTSFSGALGAVVTGVSRSSSSSPSVPRAEVMASGLAEPAPREADLVVVVAAGAVLALVDGGLLLLLRGWRSLVPSLRAMVPSPKACFWSHHSSEGQRETGGGREGWGKQGGGAEKETGIKLLLNIQRITHHPSLVYLKVEGHSTCKCNCN